MYKVGIVGAGRMGQRRAATAHAHPESAVTLIYDEHASAATELATEYRAAVAASQEELITADLDIAVVATTHDSLAPISTAALLAGKHVLCEKPLGRNPQEARQAVAAAEQSGRVLKVGYNHRYHPAVQKLHAVCTAGEIGPLLSIRARYGHGGRPGEGALLRGSGRRKAPASFVPRTAASRPREVTTSARCAQPAESKAFTGGWSSRSSATPFSTLTRTLIVSPALRGFSRPRP